MSELTIRDSPFEAQDSGLSQWPVVGIGSSAGGLEACGELLNELPGDTGMAFVLVQHLEPHNESHLAEILGRSTTMPVNTVVHGAEVKQNQVYVVPPNVELDIKDRKLLLTARQPNQYYPIDHFLSSLASDQGAFAVGVILSGGASDGSQGLREIKGAGGMTFAQDEASARYQGMPHSAASTGVVDFVLPPREIARELARLSAHPYLKSLDDIPNELVKPGLGPDVTPTAVDGGATPGDSASLAGATQSDGRKATRAEGQEPRERAETSLIAGLRATQPEVQKILAVLRKHTRVNFAEYKQSTVLRRIGRRIMVSGAGGGAEYLNLLEANTGELDALFRDLLISVTQFFREPETFAALEAILAKRLAGQPKNVPFRVWVPGCATGEEVYSLGMMLTEIMEASGVTPNLQLFGTDISDVAINKARAGVYPEMIVPQVGEERLDRFFTRATPGYRIAKSLRESCIFARHDVVRDPPFSHLDLVSCRNVMIYLGTNAQQRVLQALHYSLQPEGLLLLGRAESIVNRTDLFLVRYQENRIYTRLPATNRLSMSLPDPPGMPKAPGRPKESGDPPANLERQPAPVAAISVLANLENRATRMLRDLYAPPAVTVNEAMQIVYFHGQTSLYLEPPTGEASLNLFRVAHPELVYALRKTIDTAAERDDSVEEHGVRFERAGDIRTVTLRAIPFQDTGQRYYLVAFQDGTRSVAGAANSEDGDPGHGLQLARSQQELDDTRDYLRRVIEQHEVAVEELRAANEEVQSSNEEMQSTNEELRTAKEELQSSNEELLTVNEELKNVNCELGNANNDLNNVLNAVNLPIVMVGMDYRVRRYTQAAERLLNIAPSDLGRVVMDVQQGLQVPGLGAMLGAAIQTLAVQQTKAKNREGRWQLVQARPYRTVDDRIDGAVLSFLDIDETIRALEQAESARDFAEGIVETVQHPLLVLDQELRVQRVTLAFYRVFQTTPEETEGQSLFQLGSGQWDVPRLRELLNEALIRDVPFRDLDVEQDFRRVGHRTMRLNARRIAGRYGKAPTVLLAIEDVTERKEAAEIQYRRIFESAKDGILVLDGETGLVTDVNPHFLELTRYPKNTIEGHPFWAIPPFLKAEEGRRLVPETMAKKVARYESVSMHCQDGTVLQMELISNRYQVRDRVLIQINARDVTQKRQQEEDLRRSNMDLQQFAFAASHDLQEPLRTVINQVQLLKRAYGSKLGVDADHMIEFITAGTERMRQMVLDLLSYAQTARAEITITPVSVQSVLAMAMANLQLAIENTGARITFDHLPVVPMDQTQLLQLLQNLIANALKYRGKEPPVVHLAARQGRNEWIFSVADNGLGIDPKHFEDIFTVFKRLHGREYPGTGIGLATCRRIVERHNGRIWVQSKVGKGSIFYFTVRSVTQDTK